MKARQRRAAAAFALATLSQGALAGKRAFAGWNLEDALYRHGYISEHDLVPHRDLHAFQDHGLVYSGPIDHGLMAEHFDHGLQREHPHTPILDQGHTYFSDHLGYVNTLNDVAFNNVHCLSDADCCEACTCEVISSFRHVSECVPMRSNTGYSDMHTALHGEEENEQEDNAERGHFEIGYWCLKDMDCASKKCAQVGPRRYDKECQEKGYKDFELLPKKKRGPHSRRGPGEETKGDKAGAETAAGQKGPAGDEQKANLVPPTHWYNFLQ